MRVIKHTQNVVIQRVKAHYLALGRTVAEKHFYGNTVKIYFGRIYYNVLVGYERLLLKYEKLNRFKQYANDGIWMPRRREDQYGNQ